MPSTPDWSSATAREPVELRAVERHALLALGPGRDERGPPRAEQAVKHPAVGAFAVAHAPPIVGFGDHLDGKPGAREHPDDRLVGARPLAHINLVGFEADEARNGQRRLAGRARPPPASRCPRRRSARWLRENQRQGAHEPDRNAMPHPCTHACRQIVQPEAPRPRIGAPRHRPRLAQKSERIVALGQDDALSRKAASVRESGALPLKRLKMTRGNPLPR